MKRIVCITMSFLVVISCLISITTLDVSATQSRSYNFNKNFSITGNGAQDIVNVARAQLGKTKSQLGYTEAWCADFVGDCASLAGLGDRIPAAGYCGALYTNIKNAGGYEVSSPQLGDIVFYYCTASYCPNSGKPWVHVGIMVDSVNSIEGNYGGKVSSVSGHYRDCNSHTTESGVVVKKYLRPNYGSKPCSCSDSYAGDYVVTTNNNNPLNMRSGHGTGYSVIASIPSGTTVYVSKADGNWAHVNWNGHSGYCSMQYLQKKNVTPAPTGYNISISSTSFYESDPQTVTITPYDSNISNYKLHFIAPDGRITDPDLGNKNYLRFGCRGVYGTWKVYAEVSNSGGTFKGATDNGCLSFTIKKLNWGTPSDLGSDFYAQIGSAVTSESVLTHASLSDYTNVYMSKNVNRDNQIFKFARQSDGSYVIKSRKNSDYCLDVKNDSYVSGTNVGIYSGNGTNAQKWMIYSAGNGYYRFKPINCNAAILDVEGASSNEGTNVQLYTYNGTNAQKFSINKIGSSSLSVSKSSLTLDLANNPTSTVTVTATGLLPTQYTFSASRDTNVFTTKWGDWDGNSAPYTITAKKIGSYKIDFKLKDNTNNDTVLATKTINVSVKCSHKYTSKTVSPTCSEKGYTLHTCNFCGDTYKDNYTNAKEHNYGEWKTTKYATCTETGTKTRTCTICEKKETQTINAMGHKYTEKVVAPKANEQGYTLHTCTVCGDSYKDNYTAPIKPVEPTTLSLNATSLTLEAGKGYSLSATVYPSNATNKTVTWSSSNTSVATVSTSGYVTAKAAGTATITAKTSNGKTASCKVKVNPKSVANTPQIVVDSKAASPGSKVIVNVSLKNNPGIVGMTLKLSYNSNVLTLEKAESVGIDAVFSQNLITNPFVISWQGGTNSLTANGSIVKLTFAVKSNAKNGTYPVKVTYNADDIYNIREENVRFEPVDGSVKVSSYLPGDINQDGKVNLKDVTRLHQYVAGWNVTVNKSAIDVNGDGKVNLKDVTRLHQYVAGWKVEIY